jgi:hypothetical protein
VYRNRDPDALYCYFRDSLRVAKNLSEHGVTHGDSNCRFTIGPERSEGLPIHRERRRSRSSISNRQSAIGNSAHPLVAANGCSMDAALTVGASALAASEPGGGAVHSHCLESPFGLLLACLKNAADFKNKSALPAFAFSSP